MNDKDKSQSVPVVVKWSWDCSDILRCGCPGAGGGHALGIGEHGRSRESEGPWCGYWLPLCGHREWIAMGVKWPWGNRLSLDCYWEQQTTTGATLESG